MAHNEFGKKLRNKNKFKTFCIIEFKDFQFHHPRNLKVKTKKHPEVHCSSYLPMFLTIVYVILKKKSSQEEARRRPR